MGTVAVALEVDAGRRWKYLPLLKLRDGVPVLAGGS